MKNPDIGDVMNKFEVLGIVGEGKRPPSPVPPANCPQSFLRQHRGVIPDTLLKKPKVRFLLVSLKYWSAAGLARCRSYFFFSFSQHISIFIFLKALVDRKAKALR